LHCERGEEFCVDEEVVEEKVYGLTGYGYEGGEEKSGGSEERETRRSTERKNRSAGAIIWV
jgi:hypothetical protein